MESGQTKTREKPNRGWIWFFVTLAVLTVTATTVLIAFNLRQQLNPQKLAEARELWKAHGPRDYDLKYTERGSIEAEYVVKVRNGQVIYAEPDNRPLEVKRSYYGMPALFDFLEDFLDKDAKPGERRTFTVAVFDPTDGHLLRYVRRVTGGTERLEIIVQLTPVSPDGVSKPSRIK